MASLVITRGVAISALWGKLTERIFAFWGNSTSRTELSKSTESSAARFHNSSRLADHAYGPHVLWFFRSPVENATDGIPAIAPSIAAPIVPLEVKKARP